jgi:hypothetical protein
LNSTIRSTKPGKRERQVLDDRPAGVSTDGEHRIMPKLSDERVEVAGMAGHVVEAVGADIGVAETA